MSPVPPTPGRADSAAAAVATAAAATAGRRPGSGGMMGVGLNGEVDDDVARVTGHIGNADLVAVTLLELVEQRQGVVIVDETHGFAVIEGFEGAEDGGMAEALGDATRVEEVY